VALAGRLRNRLAERQERFAEAVRRTWEVRRVLYPNGGQRVPDVFQRAPELARRAGQTGGAALRSLLRDPAYHARFGQHVAEAKGGRVQAACAVCGAPFWIKRSALKDGERHLCSQACIREFRRLWAAEQLRRPRTFTVEGTCAVCGAAFRGRRGQRFCSRRCNDRAKRRRVARVCRTCGAPFVGETGQRFCSPACGARFARPEANARLSAAARQRGRPHAAELRAADAAAFAALPPLARRLVRRYDGLDDGRPWSLRELARAEHVEQVRLARLIADGVAEVLGHR
jgi:predicted nucleic acid-binding Zn ribbon protein